MRSDETVEEKKEQWGETSKGDRLALSRTLLSIMKDGVFFADKNLRVRYANPSFSRTAGLDAFEDEPPTLRDLYPEPMNDRPIANAAVALESVGFWSGELTKSRQSGRPSIEELRIALAPEAQASCSVEDGPCYVGVVRDVTEEREALERLAWTRNHDELTGLPNRTLFSAAVDSIIKRNQGTSSCFVVVTADLDDFKRYNTDYGHECGDMLLRAVGKRVASTVRAGDISARTAGDEFSVLMPVRSPEEAQDVAAKVKAAFDEPIEHDGKRFPLRASLGVAVWPRDGADSVALLAAADVALQACKDSGRNGIIQFEESLYLDRRGRTSLEADLRCAIDSGLLAVHYQPVVRVSTGAIDSVEALVRWNDPIRGDVAPENFIPLAEETGLIVRLGELVMRSACRQGGAWSKGDGAALKVSVNVSPVQLERPEFPNMIAEVLEATGLPPERLIVEITESVLLESLDDAALGIARLKALGVSLSVDDFGTGYSSLTYLKNLPIDIVKIDREFIKDIESSSAALEIVSGIIGLAHRMGLSVVAEGVETAEQFYLLRSMDCDHAQGFLFSHALPALELEGRYLARGSGSRYSSFRFRR
ncbi:MAG: EAL domain-containing protein [Spirochaetes bacterium]|nr:EAL domain-containing protein [Spirochaetota bacterium]MBU1079661.1 EAL domain-containing protein [Spirochaetota bacterium]